jgi:hypothetical protein
MGLPMAVKQGEDQKVIEFIIRMEDKSLTQSETIATIIKQYETETVEYLVESYPKEIVAALQEWASTQGATDLFSSLIAFTTTTEPDTKSKTESESPFAHPDFSPIGFEELLKSALAALTLALRLGTKEQALASVESMFTYRQKLLDAQSQALSSSQEGMSISIESPQVVDSTQAYPAGKDETDEEEVAVAQEEPIVTEPPQVDDLSEEPDEASKPTEELSNEAPESPEESQETSHEEGQQNLEGTLEALVKVILDLTESQKALQESLSPAKVTQEALPQESTLGMAEEVAASDMAGLELHDTHVVAKSELPPASQVTQAESRVKASTEMDRDARRALLNRAERLSR